MRLNEDILTALELEESMKEPRPDSVGNESTEHAGEEETLRLALLNQGRDASRLSHDLNNKVFAVSGRVELLKDALKDGDVEKIQKYLDGIVSELTCLGERVQELNDIAHRYDLLLGVET